MARENFAAMVQELDAAHNESLDPFTGTHVPTSWKVYSGKPGRPRIEVNIPLLEGALEEGRLLTNSKPTFKCSTRTLTQRLQGAGVKERGEPVFVEVQGPDEMVVRQYNSTAPKMTPLTDEALDEIVAEVLQDFLDFGRSMIAGALKVRGVRVSSTRQRQSRVRVHGAPGVFGVRKIQRRRYKVPGANSLWHHDGQHGKLYGSHRKLID
jgi:hypothetical protein